MEDGQAPDSGTLKYLRALVTVLTVTMIVGFVIIVALFVMRFPEIGRVELPEAITLPDDARATAFTQGGDWYAVVTDLNEILIFSKTSGKLRQRVKIVPE